MNLCIWDIGSAGKPGPPVESSLLLCTTGFSALAWSARRCLSWRLRQALAPITSASTSSLNPSDPWLLFIVVQSLSCVRLCDSTDYNMPGSSVLHCLPEFTQIHVHSIGRWCYLIISSSCHPLLLLPSIFPSIRVFSNESDLHIRWPMYWSFSNSPSNEYSGLISFTID